MPKKEVTKEKDLEEKVNTEVDNEDMYEKIEKSIKEKDLKDKDKLEDKIDNNQEKALETKKEDKKEDKKASSSAIDFNKEGVTITEIVSKINEEKGQIKNLPIVKKKTSYTSMLFIILGIAIIWCAIYYLFLSPNAYFSDNKVKQDEKIEKPTNDSIPNNDNQVALTAARLSAQNFIDAATLWYNDALLRYGSLTDVKVLNNGRIFKLNEQDEFNLKSDEKLNIKGSLPNSINSMIISKEGIIVVSQINFNDYCFDYDGEILTNVKCQ